MQVPDALLPYHHVPYKLHVLCMSMTAGLQVELALNILDGASFRDDPKQVIRVQRAKFEQKGGEYVTKKKNKSKKKAAGVLTKQEKELGWGGFDDKLSANKVCPILTIRSAETVLPLPLPLVQCRSSCDCEYP